jgi:uncharacterized protein (DUF305 family)
MEKTSWVLAAILLVVGLGVGYMFGQGASTEVVEEDTGNASMIGAHTMPDGSVMENESMSMAEMMEAMNAELEGKTGDAFDQAFLAEMIVHHQGAVEMAELAVKHAKHEEIQDLAQVIITAQNAEIADMQAWQEEWYGEDR